MKVIIDCLTYVSCGSCRDTCPALFGQDPEDSFSRIVGQYRLNGNRAGGTPPLDLESCARDAADLCTVQIIRRENG
jgi:ferredoxin